jgi:hypothetical protein
MRKESKVQQRVNIAGVQGYHSMGNESHTTNYAFRGFTGNWYFNSDRKEKTRIVNGLLVRTNGQPLSGFGLEVEVECTGTMNQTMLAECLEKVVFSKFKFGADMFKMQNDISLGGDSNAEIITQIMTKSRIRNDYSAWKVMFDNYFPAFGVKADSYYTSCGMHVNVSNAIFGKTEEQQIEALRKLYYIVNKHYSLMCKALYRSPEKSRWCGRMDYNVARRLDVASMENDHTKCLNYSHFREGRVEIRLVGGQRDYYGFRNTMETVFFLCDRVRSISWNDCENLVAIFKGCNQYVYKRLSTECNAFITPAGLQAIEQNVKPEDLELR